VLVRIGDPHQRGEVEHHVAALDGLPYGVSVAHVAPDALQVGKLVRTDVLEHPYRALGSIAEKGTNVPPLLDQRLGQVTPDEASRSGNQDSLAAIHSDRLREPALASIPFRSGEGSRGG